MSAAAVLGAVLALLKAAPELVADVKALIAAFEGGGASAAQGLIASKVAQDTAALEQALQTPIKAKS